jgi:hypothetical protein
MKIIGSDHGLHTPEFHKKKVWQERIKTAIILLITAVMIGIPIYLLRTEKFLISSVLISGNSVTKSEDIQKIIAEGLSGNYLWIFPRSNTAIFPKDKIVSDLKREIPRLSSVTVMRSGKKGIEVAVTERSPKALYCVDVSDPSSPANCYFMDDTGYIFSIAPAFSGNVYLTYNSAPFYDEPLGKQAVDKEELKDTLSFVSWLGTLGIYPRVFLIKMDEYRLVLANGAELMWEKNADLDSIRANLTAFFSQDSIRKEKDFLERVLYIDMRFGNKIFYKFREAE